MTEQGETYATFVESELKSEYDRRTSIDARALAVVTSSSAFLALIVSVVALLKGKDHTFGHGAGGAAVVALACFVVAGALGLVANMSREYQVAAVGTLREMTKSHWTDSEIAARNICAGLGVTTIASLRAGTDNKAKIIAWAVYFQLAAVLAVVTAVGWDLLSG
ncbi:MAG: hypothetical protein QOE45_3355 [Frankiaceae bacterium]|jgi:hypothetical protein|nr:hypothetical protein [Frankiaceae bacterium]